jgi:threonine aldolase
LKKNNKVIDLRSDTVTKPTKEMLAYMNSVAVGDDVFKEDPTVNLLEEKLANMFGKEAGIFCPSGTMTNQIAIKLHTQPGDEVICDRQSHVYNYEGGGIAYNSLSSVRLIHGDKGRFKAMDVLENINNRADVHLPNTSLVCVENTSNRGGGCCYDLEDLIALQQVCRQNNLKFHLDGARIFNALIAKNETALEHGKLFDTISICLSKGLGAPVGSVLIGSGEAIQKARRIRKIFGGGMRQAGYLAAAGIYALDHHVDRLKKDHQKAKETEAILQQLSFVKEVIPVETNIVVFKLQDDVNLPDFIQNLKKENILAMPFGPQMVRMVMHLDITDDMVEILFRQLKNLNI